MQSPLGKSRGHAGSNPAASTTRKVFVPEKPKPVPFRDLMDQYAVPPRNPCHYCGAVPGGDHAADCPYADWPRQVADAEYRPSMAWSMGAPDHACIDCGAVGIIGWSGASALLHPGKETPAMVEHDRHLHKWWCPFWGAHPDVQPF